MIKCDKCGLSKTAINPCVMGEGDRGSGIMLIGEAPGEEEDRASQPFVGRSGILLREAIVELTGTSPAEACYITNTIKCRPPYNELSASTKNAALEACEGYLKREIRKVNPLVIVCLGAVAWNWASGTTGIKKYRGLWKNLELEGKSRSVIATWHPAHVLRYPGAVSDLYSDLKEAFKRVKKGV